MTWRRDRLPDIVRTMAGRPRHEALRGLITELLHSGFAAPYAEIAHEVYLLDHGGRIDTLWGATVIELKSDLRREIADVLARMPAYLADAGARSGSPTNVTGLATDGAEFIAYALRDGALTELARYATDADRPDDLLLWLEPLLTDRGELPPAPRAIAEAFGRHSIAFGRVRGRLQSLWDALRDDPEVALKRQLWNGLLAEAYGEEVGGDALFLQHTYLVTVVKAIAARVLDLPVDDPVALLTGRALAEEGIIGAVEADFFDWLLKRAEGETLVRQVAAQAARFRLQSVEADVLKVLYESLVDPDERHDLGEYYTPDWLAFRVVEHAVDAPLTQRVLDPACGSGTFLFHAVRRLVAAGRAAGWPGARIAGACADQVRGLDVHPVAVTLARVTWLLALAPVLPDRRGTLTVPVFLGDAMQWNLRRYIDRADVLVDVPGEAPLQVPTGFAEDQALFEEGLEALNQGLAEDLPPEAVARRLGRLDRVAAADVAALAGTYAQLLALYRAGRNGIWTFVLRNLVRPVWLARPEQRADRLVGNPPWIVYRHLSAVMKDRLREGLSEYGLWVGGNLATQQDLCALFWARGAERYLAPQGRVAFVLPFALLNAPVFAALRAGALGRVRVAVTGAWAMERVWPIFGAQSGSSTTSTCVLFGARDAAGGPPAELDRWEGRLPRRDATDAEASLVLRRAPAPWPRPRTLVGNSPYRARSKNGATVFPRRFFVVDPEPGWRLGRRSDAARVRGRAGPLDKKPWTAVEPPRGPVETQFLRPLLLGKSIAPYRMLDAETAVIPLDGPKLLDAAAAAEAGYPHLAAWLRDIEAKWRLTATGPPMARRASRWRTNSTTCVNSRHRRENRRSASSTPPLEPVWSAAHITGGNAIVEHAAYWMTARSIEEARYLTALINSEAVLAKVTDLQPHGQRDRRHFDNLVWTLPIPDYDAEDAVHRDIAAAAARAEAIAAMVPLVAAAHFTAKREAIRAALTAAGIAAEIEALVDAILPP